MAPALRFTTKSRPEARHPVVPPVAELPLAVEADTREITALELTPGYVGDGSALPRFLDQIECALGSMTGDGAYDRQTRRRYHHPTSIDGRFEQDRGDTAR
jgi:hypothetical protein